MDIRKQRARQSGFTIIELLLGLAVLAVMMGVAVPAFRSMQADNAMRAATADFVTAVNTARMQAVSLRNTVTLRPITGTNWASGWRLEYPAAVISEQEKHFSPRGDVALAGPDGVDQVQFLPTGLTSAGEIEFTLCDGRTGEQGRKITISPFGRVTNEMQGCS